VKTDRDRIEDIRVHIEKIRSRAPATRDALASDEMLQVWVLYHLSVVGEAARAVSKVCRDSHPEVQWSKMVGLRNRITHGYFEIDVDVVWNVIEYDIPELGKQIATILKEDFDA
jgi:uncharacterized protein with HEPN domain